MPENWGRSKGRLCRYLGMYLGEFQYLNLDMIIQ